MAETNSDQRPKIFISYSRQDSLLFADQLAAGLELAGFETLLDRQDIVVGEDWEARLGGLILAADSVVFVISPKAVKSERCGWEVDKAVDSAKRILPISYLPVVETEIPEKLRRLQFIDFNGAQGLGRPTLELATALQQDLGWIREQTRIGELAARWQTLRRPASTLLRDDDLALAKAWAARRPAKAPEIADLQLQFLKASDDAETARAQEERKRIEEKQLAQEATARIQRRAAILLWSIGVTVVIGGVIVGWQFLANSRLQTSLALRQRVLDHTQANFIARVAGDQRSNGNLNGALRFGILGTRYEFRSGQPPVGPSFAGLELARAASQSDWQTVVNTNALFAAFNEDGSKILTYNSAAVGVREVDRPETSKELIAIDSDRHGEIYAFVMSADGSRAFSGIWAQDKYPLRGPEMKIYQRMWNVAAPEVVTNVPVGRIDSELVAFSRDGSRIAFIRPNTTEIWNSATGQKISSIAGQNGKARRVALSARGDRVALVGDKATTILDVATSKKVAAIDQNGADVLTIVFSPDDGRVVTAAKDNTATIWNASTGAKAGKLFGHTAEITSIAFSRDGSRIVTASNDNTARIWDADTRREVTALRGHQAAVRSAGFDRDGSRVVTASQDGTVRIWRLRSAVRVSGLLNGDESATTAAFSRDGSRVITGSKSRTARIWDVKSGVAAEPALKHDGDVETAAFSFDGSRIVTSSDDMTVHIWDAEKLNELSVVRDKERLAATQALRPDPLRIVTYKNQEGRSISKTVVDNEDDAKDLMKNRAISVAFSRDGKLTATADSSIVTVSNSATGEKIAEANGQFGSVAFSPDGRHILTASDDGTIRTWDASTGQRKMSLSGHKAAVTSAVFSPDGRRILTSSDDATAVIWDADTGNRVFELRRSGDEPLSITESIQFFHKTGDGVASAAFSPDGNQIVTASAAGARIWNVHAATAPATKLVEELCATHPAGLSTLTRDEMRLLGYPEDTPAIDVCRSAIP
jgi:WD40 repeat protein